MGEDWVPEMGQKLMHDEALHPGGSGTCTATRAPRVLLGGSSQTRNFEAMLPKPRLQPPSSPPSGPEDDPTGRKSLSICKIQKGTAAQGCPGTLTDGVHPRDHLILAQVLAGLVVSRAP